jgi:hypothetical protein
MAKSDGLEAHVQSLLSSVGTFFELSELCLGAWPSDVLNILASIGASNHPNATKAHALADNACMPVTARAPINAVLPAEHPLDFDWRFNPRSCRELLDRVTSGLDSSDRLLLVCAPSVALFAHSQGLGHQIIVGTRPSDPVIESLRFNAPTLEYTDINELEAKDAAALLIDPPWYDDVAIPLLSQALRGVRVGGSVWICGPDHYTRPSAATSLLDEHASLANLGIAKSDNGQDIRARYTTPSFESRTLSALGLRNVSPNWRTGLVRAYRKTHDVQVSKPMESQRDWKELGQGQSRIWFREALALDTSAFEQIVISPSVSRTNPLQSTACVWTSNNTVVIGAARSDLEIMSRGRDWRESPLGLRIMSVEAAAC